MRHTFLMQFSALSVSALSLIATPALAQTAEDVPTADQISQCLEDRSGEGCATVLIRVMVCAQAPELPGCEAINEHAEEAAGEIDPDVDVRAEGELAEPADDDEDDADEESDDADVDTTDESADEDNDVGADEDD